MSASKRQPAERRRKVRGVQFDAAFENALAQREHRQVTDRKARLAQLAEQPEGVILRAARAVASAPGGARNAGENLALQAADKVRREVEAKATGGLIHAKGGEALKARMLEAAARPVAAQVAAVVASLATPDPEEKRREIAARVGDAPYEVRDANWFRTEPVEFKANLHPEVAVDPRIALSPEERERRYLADCRAFLRQEQPRYVDSAYEAALARAQEHIARAEERDARREAERARLAAIEAERAKKVEERAAKTALRSSKERQKAEFNAARGSLVDILKLAAWNDGAVPEGNRVPLPNTKPAALAAANVAESLGYARYAATLRRYAKEAM